MAKKISDEIISQIPVLYEQFKNKTEVAKQLNISVATVNKYLNIYNSSPDNVVLKKRTRVKVDEALIEQINIAYQNCKNMNQVAKELNISAATVKKYLNEESLKLKEKILNERDALFYYIYHLFGPESEEQPVSEWNITQMNKFNSMGISYRAQLLTLKYYYEVMRKPVQEKYRTIGLIPHIYDSAAQYYKNQAKRQKEIEEAIEKQLEQDRIEIKFNPSDYMSRRKKKKLIDLNTIAGEDK